MVQRAGRSRLLAEALPGGTTDVPRGERNLERDGATELEILGSSMGTIDELRSLLALVEQGRVKPVIDEVFEFADARQAFEKLNSGTVFGKLVLTHES